MVFVTGGTGLVGSHLIFDLIKEGKEIRASRRPSSNIKTLYDLAPYYGISSEQLDAIEWVEVALDDIIGLEEAMEGCTWVFHCAAMVSFVPGEKDALFDANIIGTQNLINAALNAHIKKLCYVSSTAAIGKGKHQNVVTENTKWNDGNKNSNYGISKHYAEREVWRGSQEGLDVVIINPCVIVGPGDWGKSSTNLFETVWNGLKYYSKGANAFIDVRDVSRAMLQLMKSEIKQERFLLIGENMPYKAFFDQVATALNQSKPSTYASPILSQIAWRFEWLKWKLTGKTPLITQETVRSAREVTEYSAAKIKSALHFEFTPISKTIQHTATIFLDQKKLN